MLHDGGPPWPYPFACNTGVRRELHEQIGGYDESLIGGGEDSDYAWRLRRLGAQPRWEPAALVHYRCRDSLRGIYRQAHGYGLGTARLASRWREDWPQPPRALSRWGLARAGARQAIRLVRHRETPGHWVWQLGWLAGVAAASAEGVSSSAGTPPAHAPSARRRRRR